MLRSILFISTSCSSVLLGACLTLDSDPEHYIEALKPDLYFVVALPYQTAAATVGFSTVRPVDPPPVPPTVRVLTWANEGGNIQDDTLGENEATLPAGKGRIAIWNVAALPPRGSVFDKIAVEMRTSMTHVAFEAVALAGGYAEVDFLGAGIVGYGEWIEAILQLWVQCRADTWRLTRCDGLNYVLAPRLQVFGIAPRQAHMAKEYFAYALIPHNPDILLVETEAGWSYRTRAPDERSWQPLEAYPVRGPFATPEDVARDLVASTGLRSLLPFDELAMNDPQFDGIRRALVAIRAELQGRYSP